jgi:hypothetical protein
MGGLGYARPTYPFLPSDRAEYAFCHARKETAPQRIS